MCGVFSLGTAKLMYSRSLDRLLDIASWDIRVHDQSMFTGYLGLNNDLRDQISSSIFIRYRLDYATTLFNLQYVRYEQMSSIVIQVTIYTGASI